MPPTVELAIVQFRPRKGDYAANLARLGPIFRQLHEMRPRPMVAHFPETVLTGYFVEGAVRELAMTAGQLAADLQRVFAEAVRDDVQMDISIGFYEIWRNRLHNSAMYVTLGGCEPVIRHIHRKLFLPTYGLFDEERFIDRGFELRAFDTSWGRAALLVCEDAWHSLSGTLAALDGAQLVLLHAAAPSRGIWPRGDDVPGPATLARWERLARDIAEEHGMFVSLAHLVGSEGGKTFAGGSMVAGPKGDVRARAPIWEEAILTAPLELDDLTRARADSPLLTDLQTMLPHLLDALERITAEVPFDLSYDAAPEDGGAQEHDAGTGPRDEAPARSASASGALPVVRPAEAEQAGPAPLEIDTALTTEFLTQFIREEITRRGFSKGIVGLSGGVDSAVTAYLAARALGPENVIAVRMPYSTSSEDSLKHARLVTEALGIEERTVDITAAVDAYLAQEPDADAARRGNVMARMRMITLFDLSARYRALPLGTGNKTERLLGYFTWHADDSPPINPIGDLYKTQVWALARHLGVPAAIVDKPASADLVEGQTDEGDLGVDYPTADRVLNWLLSGYHRPELIASGFREADVDVVVRRLAGTHWKRRLPTVAMLSPTAIGESYLRPVDF
jgi:NAD+ synthase (glutamine-hydrolysing)